MTTPERSRAGHAGEATLEGGPVTPAQVFWAFLRLGLTSFGGPVAHLGYFRQAFVVRRRWLDEQGYGDIVALSQMLPGPASSQAGMAIGLAKAGLPGMVAAWVGFTAPSAALMMLAGYAAQTAPPAAGGVVHGLKLLAVAVVAQAVWGMARTLSPDAPRATIALGAAAAVLIAGPWAQLPAMAAGGLIGAMLLRTDEGLGPGAAVLSSRWGRRAGTVFLLVFAALLAGLPALTAAAGSHALALADSFYRSGALVFGGGHVVLPLLRAEVVPPAWISDDMFLAGYGAAQALPGPLFTFAAYLGVAMAPGPNGWAGGLICLAAIFAPSFLLVAGAAPFWDALRARPRFRRALTGVNAAVVGLLLAALYDPVWTSAVRDGRDLAVALAAFALLAFWRVSPALVAPAAAAAGWLIETGVWGR